MNRGFADLRVEPLHHVAKTRLYPGSARWMAAPRGFEPRFTDPKSAVLPLDEGAAAPSGRMNGAEDGTRTRDPHLGKVMLYQLSHFRSEIDRLERWCRGPGSNWRHRDFQSRALPTELPRPDGQPVGCPSADRRIPRAFGGLPPSRRVPPRPVIEFPGLGEGGALSVEPAAFRLTVERAFQCRMGARGVPDDVGKAAQGRFRCRSERWWFQGAAGGRGTRAAAGPLPYSRPASWAASA